MTAAALAAPTRPWVTLTWIPITEEFPDAESTVMVSLSGGSEPSWLGFTDGKEWFDACTGGPLDGTVTHWAELPQGVFL